jgi:hypothetical protein
MTKESRDHCRPRPTMRRAVLAMLIFGGSLARAEATTAQCSSYYISEINIVSTDDAEPGHVQTFVGFGPSKEEAEKNVLASCSRIRFEIETCLNSDRKTDRNAPSEGRENSLHSKYTKAVMRFTGCS